MAVSRRGTLFNAQWIPGAFAQISVTDSASSPAPRGRGILQLAVKLRCPHVDSVTATVRSWQPYP